MDRRPDDIEQIFRDQLHESRMMESFEEPVPALIWVQIEKKLDDFSSKKGMHWYGVVLIFCPLILGLLFYFQSVSAEWTAASGVPPRYLSDTGLVRVDLPAAKSGTAINSVLRQLQPDPFEERVSNLSNLTIQEGENADESSNISIYRYPADRTITLTGQQNTQVKISLIDLTPVSKLEGRTFNDVNTEHLRKIRKEPSCMQPHKASSWLLELKAGSSAGNYFSKGNFLSDANSLISIEKKLTTVFGVDMINEINEDLSLQFGIRYSPFRTEANYQFEIGHSDALEVPTLDGFQRTIDHNIPTVGGAFSATTTLTRGIQDEIANAELIPLRAQISQQVEMLSIPASLQINLIQKPRLVAGIRMGLEISIPLSSIKLEVEHLQSLHDKIQYESFALKSIPNQVQKALYFGYQLGAFTRHKIGHQGFFIGAEWFYTNTLSPAFQIEEGQIYPRNSGILLSIGRIL